MKLAVMMRTLILGSIRRGHRPRAWIGGLGRRRWRGRRGLAGIACKFVPECQVSLLREACRTCTVNAELSEGD